MAKLSERAMLASVHISFWSGRSVDREVTQEVSERHQADAREAGRYNKQLVAPKFLHQVGTVVSYTRTTHRVLTLPWSDNGDRILSTTGYETYMNQMRTARIKFESAVKGFIGGMSEYVDEAKSRLGTMFNAEDYPTSDEINNKFSFDVEIKEVPEAGDFRAQLSDNAVKAIQKDIERRSEARIEAAMRDVYQRIYDCTAKMAVKLNEYDPENKEGRFRDSLVYNINELADLLPVLNITGDQKLVDLQLKLKRDLVEHSPEILRVDPKARSETQRKAQAIADKVKKFLG